MCLLWVSYLASLSKLIRCCQVKFLFLALPNPEEAIARVKDRVTEGGHYVPEEVIGRRFATGLSNFLDVYRFEVNLWGWFESSILSPSEVLL